MHIKNLRSATIYCIIPIMKKTNMNSIIKYRGRHVAAEDIGLIKELISKNPVIGRCELSRQICQQWNWVQANGHLRDMVCRGLLLELERGGYIKLPPRKVKPFNPFLKPKAPEKIELDQCPIKTTLKEILPLSFVQVRRTPLDAARGLRASPAQPRFGFGAPAAALARSRRFPRSGIPARFLLIRPLKD